MASFAAPGAPGLLQHWDIVVVANGNLLEGRVRCSSGLSADLPWGEGCSEGCLSLPCSW